jgi:predicted ABC-type transport system involved in lysophospholipase L1 biosynthesis ATPase subunit
MRPLHSGAGRRVGSDLFTGSKCYNAGMVSIEGDLLDDVREDDIADLLQRARDIVFASEDDASRIPRDAGCVLQ